jgi:hypothetical protein
MTHRQRTTCLVPLIVTLACSDATGPDDLDFPELSATLHDELCIRGNATIGQTKSGVISDTDCDDGEGYTETYLVKVATSRTVTFSTTSNFDSFLILFRIDSFTSTDIDGDIVEFDDDSNDGLDARIIFDLEPGDDYLILVSGITYDEVGSYSLQIQ